jgi:hypothetical protein
MLSCLIPGPEKHSDLDSFLWLLVEELRLLQDGIPDTPHQYEPNFLLKAHCIHCAGDGPAIAEMMGFKNPGNARAACPRCLQQGTQRGGQGTYYFPQTSAEIDHPTLRENCRPIIAYLDTLVPQVRQDSARTAIGITRTSILLRVGSLNFPLSFPPDMMHQVLQNLVGQLHKIWGGHRITQSKKAAREEAQGRQDLPCVLNATQWKQLAELQENSRATIPYLLGTGPRRIGTHWKGFKAMEWREWLCRDGIALLASVVDIETFRPYLLHFALLRRIYLTSTKFRITRADVKQLDLDCKEFVRTWQELYYQDEPSLLHNCRINLHALLHLGLRLVS